MLVLPVPLDEVIESSAGNGRELALERAGDRRRHGARIGAGQAGADVEGRVVDLRQIADRQRAVGEDAEQRDRRHQQAGRDRAPDEDFGEVHDALPADVVARRVGRARARHVRTRPPPAAAAPRPAERACPARAAAAPR